MKIEIRNIGSSEVNDVVFACWQGFVKAIDVDCGFWCDPLVVTGISGDDLGMLRIVFVYDGEQLVAVLPFHYTASTIPFMFGLWRLGGVQARMFKLPDYEFPILNGYDRKVVFAEVTAELKKKKMYDLIMADNWPEPGRGARNVQTTYLIDMPEKFDDWMLLLSSNTRQVLRRRSRKMQREFGDGLYVKEFCIKDDMTELHRCLLEVWKNSWHGRLNRQSPPDISVLERLAEHSWVRSYVLFVEKKPVATVQGYQYNRVFMDEAPAYDDKWKSYSPGLVLNYFIIKKLFDSNVPQVVDFGFGYNQYKEMLGTRAEERGQLWQGISLKGKYILFGIKFCDMLFRTGKRLFGKSSFVAKLKAKAQRG